MSILEKIRKEQDWSVQKMAFAMRLPTSSYYCYERMTRAPGAEAMYKIEKFLKAHPELGYTINDIIEEYK